MVKMRKDIYHIFGKFVIEFEMNCNSLESCARSLLSREGLDNGRVVECLLAGMTAEPLSSLVQSLCYECLDLSEQDSVVVDNIFSNFKKLVSKRNDIVHGQHFVSTDGGSWAQKYDSGEKSFSIKLHKNKKGSARKVFELSPEFMFGLYEEAESSLMNFCKLYRCIEENHLIAPNFEKTKDHRYKALIIDVLRGKKA
jgi:hypothetical protein